MEGEGTEGNWTDQIWAHLVQQLASLFLWGEHRLPLPRNGRGLTYGGLEVPPALSRMIC